MIKVVQCSCGTNIKFDTDEVKIYEYNEPILIGEIVCPVCRQLVEVSRVDRSVEE